MQAGFTFYAISEIRVILGFFFFQAEDGIRDVAVTGVQTCALPISRRASSKWVKSWNTAATRLRHDSSKSSRRSRSEERRVGKSVDLGGRRIIKKKNKGRMGAH